MKEFWMALTKFKRAFALCVGVFFLLNISTYFTGPPERMGVAGRRRIGFPLAFRIDNIAYTPSGPVVTPILNSQGIAVLNFSIWGLLSYRFSRWVEQRGTDWWNGSQPSRDKKPAPGAS
jgi:hypothetical protein